MLNGSDNENSKFAIKKWYVIDSESNGVYSRENPIKFLTRSLGSSLCDYSDAYVLVTGNIAVVRVNNNTKVSFINCALFRKCRTEINWTFIDEAQHINIAMPMYNLIEHRDNYSDTSRSLWQFKRDEIEGHVDLTRDNNHIPNNSSSFKYKSSFITDRNDVKIAVRIKYLSNFWRSLEIPLINCIVVSLSWNPNCVLPSLVGNSAFTRTDAKRYVLIVISSAEDNAKLSKLLGEGLKRPVYSNKYKIIPNKTFDENDYIRELLDSSYQGVTRLFVLAYRDCGGSNRVTADSHRRYFLRRVKIENCNIEIDGRNFYDQPINDLIKQYDEVRKASTGQGDGYTTGCLLDFAYFEKNYRLIAVDLSKKKALDADSRAIQQIIFTGKIKATEANTRVIIYYILEQSKETILEFSKGTTKVL